MVPSVHQQRLDAARTARKEHYEQMKLRDPEGVAAFEQRTNERLAATRQRIADRNK